MKTIKLTNHIICAILLFTAYPVLTFWGNTITRTIITIMTIAAIVLSVIILSTSWKETRNFKETAKKNRTEYVVILALVITLVIYTVVHCF